MNTLFPAKSAAMLVTFGMLWAAFAIFLSFRIFAVIHAYTTLSEILVLLLCLLILLLFAGFSSYFIAVTVFGIMVSETRLPPRSTAVPPAPGVALLYTVCNDFQPEAALTAINQEYPNFHVFLLDDSWSDSARSQVDEFHRAHPQRTTLIRRDSRHGFKAGNLNSCLLGSASAYPYFVVLDADERLPDDFLQRTVPYLETSDLAFVQANHAPSPFQEKAFARDLGPTLLPFWDLHCRPRNDYGVVMYVGHGALIRRSAWEEVGGFSGVALEDFAFTGDLALRGKRGLYLESLLCYEDFPDGYLKFKRQYERFVAGALEISQRLSWKVLRESKLSLVERVDFFCWITPLFVPLFSLAFALLWVFGIGVVFGRWHRPTLVLDHVEFLLPPLRVIDDARFAPLMDFKFALLSLVFSLSPALACIVLGLRRHLRATRLLVYSFSVYTSTMVVSLRGVLRYLATGKTLGGFTSGGEGIAKETEATANFQGDGVGSMTSAWKPPIVAELIFGTVIFGGALVSANIALASVGLCLIVGLCIERFGWKSRIVQWSLIVCFLGLPAQVLFYFLLNQKIPGLPPLLFSIHL